MPVQKSSTVRLLLLFLFSYLFSCASSPSSKKESFTLPPSFPKASESSRQIKAMNERILLSSLSQKRYPYEDYRVGPEDLIEISVFEDEKLNKTVRVSAQGNITLPLIGILRVKGLTAAEIEKEIRELLSAKYFQNPNVSVFIREYRNQRISVIGAVEKPGVFDVTGQKTILDLLGMAGGLKEEAGQMLFLIRSSPHKEKRHGETGEFAPETLVIDLEELLIHGNFELNLVLTHGDILNVPVSGKVFVGGEVVKPGGFLLKGKRMTVNQAVVLAEGLKPTADTSRTTIFRPSKDGQKQILTVNLNAIQKGQAEDVYLYENDIVIVPKSGVKTFFIELRDTIRGIFGIGFSFGSL